MAANDPKTGSLPQARTTLVGREPELTEIKFLLRTIRLISLTGPGGSGKTRLAQQLAADVQTTSAGRVWWCDLHPLSDPAYVARTVAGALAALGEAIGHADALVVLDNCEHLLAACAELTRLLLNACPGLHFLLTSREPLRIPNEIPYPVPLLPFPGAGLSPGDDPQAVLAQYAAMRLFVERAAQAAPGIVFEPGSLPEVAQICARLDGLPLAIELAAARVKTLTLT
jgi:predicted ATPase